jgi:hypothetical protein
MCRSWRRALLPSWCCCAWPLPTPSRGAIRSNPGHCSARGRRLCVGPATYAAAGRGVDGGEGALWRSCGGDPRSCRPGSHRLSRCGDVPTLPGDSRGPRQGAPERPFFAPPYQPHRRIYIFPTSQGHTLLCTLLEQMDGPHFPVTPDRLASETKCITDDPMRFLHDQGLCLSRIPTNHPGGGYGYRIEHDGRSGVYLSDNKLYAPYPKATEFEAFAQFCRHADVLIHDAQYLERDRRRSMGGATVWSARHVSWQWRPRSHISSSSTMIQSRPTASWM